MGYYIIGSLFNYLIFMIFLILIEFMILSFYKKQGVLPINKGFIIGWQLFACLIIAILTVTGTAGIDDIGHYNEIIRLDEINLSILKSGLNDMIMNVILFIPVGILIPLLWKRNTKLSQIILIGFIFSFLIEISQLFNHRATDVNDLIMNTLGSTIGYGLYNLCLKKIMIFKIDNDKSTWIVKNSALFSIFVIFLFKFFIGSPLLSFIWSNIYG